MDKLIAVPVDEAGVLDGHFGHCKYFAMLKVEGENIKSEEKVVPPPHEPGLLPKWLSEKGVTDIIAGGMGQKAIELFNQRGVNAFVGAPKVTAEELVKSYLGGTLSCVANYCNHKDGQECSGH